MGFWSNLSKFEKRLIAGGFILFLLCLFYLQNGGSLFGGDDSGKPEIGVLAASENDARYRNTKTMVWGKAEKQQKIRLGDAIFTGSSSKANVALKKGGTVAIDENSLVVFNEIENENMANLMSGNFKVQVDGNVKFALNGEVVTLDGRNSEVQITLDKDQKPVFKTLSGAIELKRKGQAPEKIAAEIPPAPVPQPVAEEKPEPAPAPQLEVPVPNQSEKIVPYTWRLHDLYDQQPKSFTQRPEVPTTVTKSVTLSWEFPSKASQKAIVDLATNVDMLQGVRYESDAGAVSLQSVNLGEHFWRVSPDGEHWSDVQKFEVQPRFLENAEPKVGAVTTDFALLTEKVRFSMTLVAPIETVGFVGESSHSPNFPSKDTNVFWSSTPQVIRHISKPGVYYYRFRSVNKSQELSEWSEPKKFTVTQPDAPKAPSLASATREGYVGDSFNFNFTPGDNAHSHQLQILDQTGNVVAESNKLNSEWVPEAPGKYTARAVSRDVYGRVSPASPDIPLSVRKKPAPVAVKEKPKEVERLPANTETGTSAMKIEPPKVERMNDLYSSSQVAIEASMFTLQSKVQVADGSANPVATQLGLRVHHWWGNNGVEGSLKSSVFAIKQSNEGGSAKDVEIRYHRRFIFGMPFGIMREMQVSLFGGYEMYRNNGGTIFTAQYDLFKLGTYIHFPFAERWDMGGEFVYGIGTDSSKKMEMSGHLNYYLKRDVSMGVGYRVHLFEAGSLKSAPGILPYREGYTEGYSSLIYHY